MPGNVIFIRFAVLNTISILYVWMSVVAFMALASKGLSATYGAGAVLLLRSLSSVGGSFFSGAFIDRYNKKHVLLFSCLVLIILSGLAYFNGAGKPMIILLPCMAAAEAFLFPAIHSIIPGLIKDQNGLMKANSAMVTTDMAAMVAGPVAASMIMTKFPAEAVLAVVVALLGIATAILLLGLWKHLPQSPAAANSQKNLWSEAVSGIRRLGHDPFLKKWLLTGMAAYLGTGILGAVELPFSISRLGMTGEQYGWILAISGLGSVIATLFISRSKGTPASAFMIGVVVLAAAYIGYSLQTGLIFAAPFILLAGAGECSYRCSLRTLLQQNSKPEELGRISAYNYLADKTALLAGILSGSAIMSVSSPETAIRVYGCLLLAGTLVAAADRLRGKELGYERQN